MVKKGNVGGIPSYAIQWRETSLLEPHGRDFSHALKRVISGMSCDPAQKRHTHSIVSVTHSSFMVNASYNHCFIGIAILKCRSYRYEKNPVLLMYLYRKSCWVSWSAAYSRKHWYLEWASRMSIRWLLMISVQPWARVILKRQCSSPNQIHSFHLGNMWLRRTSPQGKVCPPHIDYGEFRQKSSPINFDWKRISKTSYSSPPP